MLVTLPRLSLVLVVIMARVAFHVLELWNEILGVGMAG